MLESARAIQSRMPGAQPHARPQDAPLRVALISGNYNYMMDGAARAQNMLIAHLLARGHEALVFAPTAPRPAFEHAGTLVPLPSVALPGRRAEYRLGLGLTRRARARLDAFRPDLIHITTPDLTALAALRYARRRGLPAVASFHTRFDTYARYYGMPWAEPILLRFMRWIYARCVHVYPPTESMAEELRRVRIGRELRLWGRGVDHALFAPERRDMDWRRSLGFADTDVVVAFVGRLVLEKGIDDFAEALRLAAGRNPAVRALVVGDGPERARFEARLPEAIFLGHQEGEALARAYASVDIFFTPSLTEAAGNVILEAMAAGVPCVGADVTGTHSYVKDGVIGMLSPPADGAAGYAERLLTLAANPALRARMGAAARARTLAEHNWPAVLDEVIGHYREAIAAFRA